MADSNFDIWRLQAQADIHGLLEAVRDGTSDIRKRAATALRALGATSAIPALQSILVSEKDTEIRNVLITTLDYLFQQEIDEDEDVVGEQQSRVVRLIAQLNSEHQEHVIRAAQNLAELQEKLAAEALVVVFHNRQLRADVRLAAAEALIKLESAPVEVTLLAVLRNPDWRMRRNAAAVMGQLHADWAVSPLIAALRDEQEIVRKTAFAALKRIGTPEALRAIEPLPPAPPRPKPTQPLPPIQEQPQNNSTSAVTKPLSPTPEKPAADNPSAATKPLASEPVLAQTGSLLDLEHPKPDISAPVLEPLPQLSSVSEGASLHDEEEETQPTIPPIFSDDVS